MLIGYSITKGQQAEPPEGLQLFMLWNIATGRHVTSWGGQYGSVRSVHILPDSKRALSLCGGLTLWELASGRELWTSKTYTFGAGQVGVSPDGTLAITDGCDDPSIGRIIKVWDVDTGKLIRSLDTVCGTISSFVISPDNKLAFYGCYDGTPEGSEVRLCKLDSGETIQSLDGTKGWRAGGVFTRDSKFAISPKSADDNKTGSRLVCWDVAKAEISLIFEGFGYSPIALTSDGEHVLARVGRSRFDLWNVKTGKVVNSGHVNVSPRDVTAIAYSNDGSLVFTSGVTKVGHQDKVTNEVWNISTGKLVQKLDPE
ncbi:MAG: hypothetical protein K2R98_26000 [Gemmataceae bacterium]|nr:hypothetical protein [Gemmataceae bacterium]